MKNSKNKKPQITDEKLEDLFSLMTEGNSFSKACETLGIDKGYCWRYINKDTELRQQYARAREDSCEVLAEQILDIADCKTEDDVFTADGNRVANSEWINRSRLRIDSRKWLLSKMMPKKYGDKLEVDNKGEQTVNVNLKTFTKNED